MGLAPLPSRPDGDSAGPNTQAHSWVLGCSLGREHARGSRQPRGDYECAKLAPGGWICALLRWSCTAKEPSGSPGSQRGYLIFRRHARWNSSLSCSPMMIHSWKKAVYDALDTTPQSRMGSVVSVFLPVLILLNIVALVVGTVEDIHQISPRFFLAFEAASLGVFTVEYLLRVWSCTVDPRFARPVSGRLRFIISPLALIDLLAILPFYLAFTQPHRAGPARPESSSLDGTRRSIGTLYQWHPHSGSGGAGQGERVGERHLGAFSTSGVGVFPCVLCRAWDSTRQVFQHPGDHVVGNHHPDNCGIWRCLPGHHSRADAGRVDGHLGDRTVCAARWYSGIRVH